MIKIAFTGRRKINGVYDLKNNKTLCAELLKTVESIIKEHTEVYFYTGGALGTDLLAGSLCEFLKEKYLGKKEIITTLVLPFRNQGSNWIDSNSNKELEELKSSVNSIVIVSDFSRYQSSNVYQQLQLRNEYLVDQADLLISVWDSKKNGGTWNCMKYCEKQNKALIIIKAGE